MDLLDFFQNLWDDNLQKVIEISFIIFLTVVLATILNKVFKKIVKSSLEDDPTADVTNLQFLRRIITTLIYLTGLSFIVYMIESLRHIAGSLLAGAGILAVVAGFASQQALSNIVSGIFIVLFKPYKINDRVLLKTDLAGVVEDINLRHTVIRNFENKRIIIPNSIISNEVIVNSNYSDSSICKWIDMGISYDSDITLAKKIMQEEAEKHPLIRDNRSMEEKKAENPVVIVRVIGMGDSSVNLRAWCWTDSPKDAFVLGCDLYESIKKRFDASGIEIPFPHRTIVYKNPAPENQKPDK